MSLQWAVTTEQDTVQPQQRLPLPIPTDDPAAALRFCQQLAAFLAKNPVKGEEGLPANETIELPDPRPTLSVVLPIFNEQENIPDLYRRLTVTLTTVALPYELIFVDDGSRDHSIALLHDIAATDARVVHVELARNFGHQVAISAGLEFARGVGVIIMDADLQDPPEVLPEFIAAWREGHDVVYAIREQRKESWPKRMAYAAFYRLLQRVANVEIPLDSGDFCIMDRKVVDLLVSMPERNRFVRGIRSWVGLDQIGLHYERQARHSGRPKYTFTRLVYLALDGLISFSFLPLRVITILGMIVSLIAIITAVLYAIQKLTVGLNPPGFATLIVAVLFLAGIQICTIGVIGEYIGRIFDEVKRRPLYVVRQVTSQQPLTAKRHDRRI